MLDLVPTATADEVESALSEAYGDVDAAAQQLLGHYFLHIAYFYLINCLINE